MPNEQGVCLGHEAMVTTSASEHISCSSISHQGEKRVWHAVWLYGCFLCLLCLQCYKTEAVAVLGIPRQTMPGHGYCRIGSSTGSMVFDLWFSMRVYWSTKYMYYM